MLFHILLVPDTINRRKCAVLTVDRLFEVSRCNAEQEEFLCDFVATYGDEVFDMVDMMVGEIRKTA